MIFDDKNFKKITININCNISEAIKILQKEGTQTLLVVDDKYNYLGTITDGDVRRSLLKNKNLSDNIFTTLNSKSVYVKKKLPEVFATQIMKKKQINLLPVIINKKIVGLYFLKEEKSHKNKSEIIVIMAGGKGKRLLPLTKQTPKGMLKIDGKPILEHLVLKAINYGYSNLFFSVNYLAHKIKKYFADGYKGIATIKYLHEKKKLGTAGPLSLLRVEKNKNVIVMNCDIYTGLDLNKLLTYHKNNNADVTLVAKVAGRTSEYGVIISKGKQFKSIEEKLTYKDLINTGIYVFKSECLSYLKNNIKIDMNQFLSNLKNKRKKILVYPIYEYWYDIGGFATLKNANLYSQKNEKI